MSERVLVISSELIDPYLQQNNCSLVTNNKDEVYNLVLRQYLFMDRHLAEYNNEFKQVIPYVLIRCKKKFFLLTRSQEQTETRLHYKRSLGVGGHINPCSPNPDKDIIVHGLMRELNEEISIKHPFDLKYIGVISDNTTDVSRVHLGLVYVLEATSEEIEVLEKDKMSGEWAEIDHINEHYNSLESWSQVVLNNLKEIHKG